MPAAIGATAVTKAAVPNIAATLAQLNGVTTLLTALKAASQGGTFIINGAAYALSAATVTSLVTDLTAVETSLTATLAGYGITS